MTREPEALGDLHHADRLRVALGVRHAELALEPLLDVAALLVADERDRAAVELAEAGDDRAVVGAAAVAVQLDPVVEDPSDVVERVRPVGVPGELDRAPRSPRRRRRPRDRSSWRREPLLPRPRRRAPRSSGRLREPAEPLAQRCAPSLTLRKEPQERAPDSRAARVAGRWRRGGRSGGSARRGRSRRGASRLSSAARRAGR